MHIKTLFYKYTITKGDHELGCTAEVQLPVGTDVKESMEKCHGILNTHFEETLAGIPNTTMAALPNKRAKKKVTKKAATKKAATKTPVEPVVEVATEVVEEPAVAEEVAEEVVIDLSIMKQDTIDTLFLESFKNAAQEQLAAGKWDEARVIQFTAEAEKKLDEKDKKYLDKADVLMNKYYNVTHATILNMEEEDFKALLTSHNLL